MENKSLTLRLLDARYMRNKSVYIAGPRQKVTLIEDNYVYMTAATDLAQAGYRPINTLPRKRFVIWYILTSDAVLIIDKWEQSEQSKQAEKLAKMLRREILFLSEIKKANAKKTNEREERLIEFTDYVANTKICFSKGDERIANFIEITDRIGVEWKQESIIRTENNPLGVNREKERRFYICKSERKGGDYLYGVQGGDKNYYDQSGEREITPVDFFKAAETIKSDLGL